MDHHVDNIEIQWLEEYEDSVKMANITRAYQQKA